MANPLKIAVCGASGRTGSRVAALAAADQRFHLLTRVGRAQAAAFEDEAGACGAVIDFTTPESTVKFAAVCGRAKIPFITGTTGLTDVQRAQVAAAARKTAVFMAPNFSRGVTLLIHLAEAAGHALTGTAGAADRANWNHRKGSRDDPRRVGPRVRGARRSGEGRLAFPQSAEL